MNSKLFLFCVIAIVLLGLVVAQDYEEGGEEADGGEGGGESGGDYDDSGDYVAPADGGEESDESANLAHLVPSLLNSRKKRSIDIEESDNNQKILTRVRRGGHGRVGPVYTYQKTDHKANFKWGVKHMVGKEYGK